MILYLRSPGDTPHLPDPARPGQSLCHLPLAGARAITEEQALVWLADARCSVCDPSHKYHVLSRGGAR